MRLPPTPSWLRRRRHVVAGVALLAVAGVLAGTLLIGPGLATTGSQEPVVPSEYVGAFLTAATSCPALSPGRLAGQVMAESRFQTDARSSRPGFGLAGLTDDEWNTWQPWDNADRLDPAPNILALAHLMCDLIGHTRETPLAGDPWQLALAAFRVGIGPVRQAGGVPESAKKYVSEVVGHAAFFELTPGFDGSPIPTRTPNPTASTGPPAATSPAATSPAATSPAATVAGTTAATNSPPASPRPTTATSSAGPPPTTQPPPATYLLVGADSNKCLSGYGGSGTQVIIWTCDQSDPEMIWEIRSDSTFRANGLCLSAGDPSANEVPVRLMTCDGSAIQRYVRNSAGEIRNVLTGRCVDVKNERTWDGAVVILYPCNGQTNQRWSLA